jgi:selenocysteine lyase/cysteine desulfurase
MNDDVWTSSSSIQLLSERCENSQWPTAGKVLTADEVASVITVNTRVVCLTWVHSLSGQMIDLAAIGAVCRDAGVLFVVNGSQGVGAIPTDGGRPCGRTCVSRV